MFNGIDGGQRDDTTIAHESLHGFGLYHTHKDVQPIPDADQKYVYPYGNDPNNVGKATGNIMDYIYLGQVEQRTCFYKWQWQIIQDDNMLQHPAALPAPKQHLQSVTKDETEQQPTKQRINIFDL